VFPHHPQRNSVLDDERFSYRFFRTALIFAVVVIDIVVAVVKKKKKKKWKNARL
jgi:hypothetical protein